MFTNWAFLKKLTFKVSAQHIIYLVINSLIESIRFFPSLGRSYENAENCHFLTKRRKDPVIIVERYPASISVRISPFFCPLIIMVVRILSFFPITSEILSISTGSFLNISSENITDTNDGVLDRVIKWLVNRCSILSIALPPFWSSFSNNCSVFCLKRSRTAIKISVLLS